MIENYVKTLMAAAETPVCALARPRGFAYRERSERRLRQVRNVFFGLAPSARLSATLLQHHLVSMNFPLIFAPRRLTG